MTAVKSIAKLAAMAAVILGMNGLINYSLMMPLQGSAGVLNQFHLHLDDAGFILVFGLVALVFWAMFVFLPRERGFVYLGTISFLTSMQLFWDWDGKTFLFGTFPYSPHGSLVIKCAITFLFFSFAAYLLNTAKNWITRISLWAGGILCAAVLGALLLCADDAWFSILNLLFLVDVFLNMALCVSQFYTLLRHKENQEELRFIGAGFILFAIVLFPDPAKDLLEAIEGRNIGYQMSFWEECLEDTFSWALLSLLSVFGIVFVRRFVQTMKDNLDVSEELMTKNAALEQEVETRQRLDEMFSAMLRTYRTADLEQSIIREGQRYFHPYRFSLVKYDFEIGAVSFVGLEGPSSEAGDIAASLQAACHRHHSGEAIVTRKMVLVSAGGADKSRLYLAVYSANGSSIFMEERDKFALLLMGKYVATFYDYLQLIESRLMEIEQRQEKHAPWLSKLFMQIAEKERKRLASDLHDEVLQELLHIRRLLDRAPAAQGLQEHKDQLRIGLENAEFMIRETCSELMPSFLSDHGVIHAVSRLVEKTKLRVDFQLEFQAFPFDIPLNDEQMTAIYRIVQELINNAVKHSEASRVTLEIGPQESALQIRYTDDGKGMDTDAVFSSTSRLGLRGMMERVRMLGGEVWVASEPGLGVQVQCSVPV